MAQLGFRKFEDMVGRATGFVPKKRSTIIKAQGLDFSKILYAPEIKDPKAIHLSRTQPNRLEDHLDWQIIEKCKPAIEKGQKVQFEMKIRNVNRTVGTILSHD